MARQSEVLPAVMLYLSLVAPILFLADFLLLMFERARGHAAAAHEDIIIRAMVLVYVLAAIVAVAEFLILTLWARVRDVWAR